MSSAIVCVERQRSRSPVSIPNQYKTRLTNISGEDGRVLMTPGSYESYLESFEIPNGFNRLRVDDRKLTVSGEIPMWIRCFGDTPTSPNGQSYWRVKVSNVSNESYVHIGFASYSKPHRYHTSHSVIGNDIQDFLCCVDADLGKYVVYGWNGREYQFITSTTLKHDYQFVPYVKMRPYNNNVDIAVEILPVAPTVVSSISEPGSTSSGPSHVSEPGTSSSDPIVVV
jgi:hypothetical protein